MKITNLFRMSSDKGRTCAFTGHRPQNLPFRFNENDDRCIALKQKLRDCIVQLIEQEGVRHSFQEWLLAWTCTPLKSFLN